MAAQPGIVVVRFSAAFGALWNDLPAALRTPFWAVAPNEVRGVPRTDGVILAAGGVEREAVAWLEARDVRGAAPVWVVGLDPSRRVAVQAIRHGAADYFVLPEDAELLHNALAAEVRRHGSSDEEASRPGVPPSDADSPAFHPIAGTHPSVRTAIQRAVTLLKHPRAAALLVGEPGTGKELLARCVHEGSERRTAAFVRVHCSTVAAHTLAQQLFGREKNAEDPGPGQPGLFEIADGGTLFLDDVETLPADLQVRVLRVLDEQECQRLGGGRGRPVDVRVIAATAADLAPLVRSGAFRNDLYLRLSGITIELPALRDRGDDVLVIAQRLLQGLADLHDVPVPELSAEARRMLSAHSWPGNIRELKSLLETAMLLSPVGGLNTAELVPHQAPARPSPPLGLPFPAELEAITVAAARAMLDVCGGNVSEAARRLKISRSRLRRLMRASEHAALTTSAAGT